MRTQRWGFAAAGSCSRSSTSTDTRTGPHTDAVAVGGGRPHGAPALRHPQFSGVMSRAPMNQRGNGHVSLDAPHSHDPSEATYPSADSPSTFSSHPRSSRSCSRRLLAHPRSSIRKGMRRGPVRVSQPWRRCGSSPNGFVTWRWPLPRAMSQIPRACASRQRWSGGPPKRCAGNPLRSYVPFMGTTGGAR
jgi:hypothetical protein